MNAAEVTNQLGQLREKLQRLRALDVSHQQFGAKSHSYRLGSPLAEVELRFYEQQYGVEFPYEYRSHGCRCATPKQMKIRPVRSCFPTQAELGWGTSGSCWYLNFQGRFLMEIGHGGAGPFYGLFPLDSHDPEFLNMFGGDLRKPFPWTSSFNPDGWERGSIGDLEGVEWDKDGKYVGMFLPGALYLCHCGCAIRNFLIVRGPCIGEVWRDDQASRKGIFPEIEEQGNRLGFLDWYEQWLDQSLLKVKGPD